MPAKTTTETERISPAKEESNKETQPTEITSKYQERIEEFLKDEYFHQIEELGTKYPEEKSLIIDYLDLDAYDPEIAEILIKDPYRIIEEFEEALKSQEPFIGTDIHEFEPNVRFKNLPDEYEHLIKTLSSKQINRMISFEGVVKKITEVKPKITKGVFQCVHCEQIHQVKQNYRDNRIKTPDKCQCGRKSFKLLEEESEFVDTQKLEIQEKLERTRGREQPSPISGWIQEDLTNKIQPGDNIEATGILRLNKPKKKRSIYNKYVDVNYIDKKETEFEELKLTQEDEERIKELSNDPLVYEKIVNSIAPSIWGYEDIKEAITLQLFGGTKGKRKPDGMTMRSDIHILLIGDPGTAKSQLLQYVEKLTPKGIYVGGESSTSAGLSASAEKDEFGDEGWTLKAGALVLAAGGMALVDELDKIGKEDRASLHQAMESQKIRVAKAGMVSTFKANASILAAANPKYGRFDPHELPAEQFALSSTLMSRFDIMFPIRDEPKEDDDKKMADHILKTHRAAGERIKERELNIEEETKEVTPDVDPELLRKYIAYARKNIHPILTDEAKERIQEFYIEMRKIGEQQEAVPITARQLEAVIRLAEASAKGRLSEKVQLEDAERAIRLQKTWLRKIGMDPETGQFDIDIIATGSSKSQMDKMKKILKIVKKINKEYDEAPYDAIKDRAKEEGIDEEELTDVLKKLKKNGDVYTPAHNVYKPA